MSTAIDKIKKAAKSIIDKKDGEIRLLKTELKKATGEKVVSFKMPDTMEVRNFPAVQSVKIENHPDVIKVKIENQLKKQDVNVLNLKDLKFPDVQKVHIENDLSVEKTSSWVPTVIAAAASKMAEKIAGTFVKLWDMGLTVRLSAEERQKPLMVIMVDEKGNVVKSLGGGAVAIPMRGGGLGSSGGGTPIATAIGTGRMTVTSAGTPVVLGTSVTCQSVTICALESNVGKIYVGDQNVNAQLGTERGTMLEPTGSTTISITNISKIYLDSVTNGDGVSFTYLIS